LERLEGGPGPPVVLEGVIVGPIEVPPDNGVALDAAGMGGYCPGIIELSPSPPVIHKRMPDLRSRIGRIVADDLRAGNAQWLGEPRPRIIEVGPGGPIIDEAVLLAGRGIIDPDHHFAGDGARSCLDRVRVVEDAPIAKGG